MNSRIPFLLIASLMLLISRVFLAGPHGNELKKRTEQQVPVIVLESSEGIVDQSSFLKGIAASPGSDRTVYALDRSTGDVVVHGADRKSFKRFSSFVPVQDIEAFAIGPQGNIYLADSASSQVRALSPAGEPLGSFAVGRALGLGALADGNVVVASSAGEKLLHIYDPTGSRLRDFGEIRSFDPDNNRENRFLNRGKLAIGRSDSVYYVSKYSPIPVVSKFSSKGQLRSEFVVQGEAIDYQLNVANGFLREKEPNVVGGVDVITSATVDPSTDHLWLSMNGTSKTGVVYEYDSSGLKLHEYAFLLNGPSSLDIITGVKDLVVRNPWIYILTWEGSLYRFNLNSSFNGRIQKDKNQRTGSLPSSRAGSLFAPKFSTNAMNPLLGLQLPCPTVQPFSCQASCRSGSTPTTEDCGAEAGKRLAQGDTITGGSCSNSAGPEPSCSASINFCNTGTGTRGTISLTLTCNAPPTPTPTPDEGGCTPETCPGQCFQGLCTQTPIVIDVLGNGFNLTNLEGGVTFDLNADGTAEHLSWTSAGSDDAWLALDRDNDGTIDNGTELFGEFTPQPDPPAGEKKNGFLALAEYDKPENGGNGDGVIDRRDAIFSSLRLWQDTNHNGISEPGELHTLRDLGLKVIDLDYKVSRRTDQYGNQFRYRAKVKDTHDAQLGRWAWDVYLVTGH